MLRGKKTLRLKFRLQLLKGYVKRAEPVRLHAFCIELICAVPYEHGDPSTAQDFHPVLGAELQLAGPSEHNRFQTGIRVLQRKIKVSRTAVNLEVGDLALYINVFEHRKIIKVILD